MAESSTTTLIEAVNRVLENIGERRVLSINTPVGRKAVAAFADALTELNSMNDWQWSKEYIPAQSWLLEKADLGDTLRVHNVQYGSSTLGWRNVRFMNLEEFDYRIMLSAYGGAAVWTQETYNTVRVYPYPPDTAEQAKYRFYVTREFIAPTVESDTFPVPERHMMLLYYRVQAILALTHLDDQQAHATFTQQYLAHLQNVRNREMNIPTFGTNVFKQRGLRRGY